MIEESLKLTIVQYEQKKQRRTSTQEKVIFKWKVIALALCILAIILLGLLSQLMKEFKDQEMYKYNTTFLPELLQQSDEINTIKQVQYLMTGLNRTQRVRFESSQKLQNYSEISSSQLLNQITFKKNILYVFNFLNEQEDNLKFGMLLRQAFDYEIENNNHDVEVYDPEEDRSSVLFNLQSKNSIRMNLHSSCKLYNYNRTSESLIILQSFHIGKQSSNQMKVHLQNPNCFSSNSSKILQQFHRLTGIKLSSLDETLSFELQNVQVFQLSQIEQDNLQF